jgi:hypothetical protein
MGIPICLKLAWKKMSLKSELLIGSSKDTMTRAQGDRSLGDKARDVRVWGTVIDCACDLCVPVLNYDRLGTNLLDSWEVNRSDWSSS